MIKNFGKFLKVLRSWVGKILLLVIIIPVVLGFLSNCQKDDSIPSISSAPWLLQTYIYTATNGATVKTPSHTFYAQGYQTINKIPTIQNYYEWDGKKYIYKDGIKQFPNNLWGAVDIIRRVDK
jgi:hypothetical protein